MECVLANLDEKNIPNKPKRKGSEKGNEHLIEELNENEI